MIILISLVTQGFVHGKISYKTKNKCVKISLSVYLSIDRSIDRCTFVYIMIQHDTR